MSVRLFSLQASQVLSLTIFQFSLPKWCLNLGSMLYIFYLLPSPTQIILVLEKLQVLSLTALADIHCTKKLPWWDLRAVLIYRYRDANLENSLLLCLFSKIIVWAHGIPNHEILARFVVTGIFFLLWTWP